MVCHRSQCVGVDKRRVVDAVLRRRGRGKMGAEEEKWKPTSSRRASDALGSRSAFPKIQQKRTRNPNRSLFWEPNVMPRSGQENEMETGWPRAAFASFFQSTMFPNPIASHLFNLLANETVKDNGKRYLSFFACFSCYCSP